MHPISRAPFVQRLVQYQNQGIGVDAIYQSFPDFPTFTSMCVCSVRFYHMGKFVYPPPVTVQISIPTSIPCVVLL